MEKKKYIFETRLDVRDYECDIQGSLTMQNYPALHRAYTP